MVESSVMPTFVFILIRLLAFQIEERENGAKEAQRPGKHTCGFSKG